MTTILAAVALNLLLAAAVIGGGLIRRRRRDAERRRRVQRIIDADQRTRQENEFARLTWSYYYAQPHTPDHERRQ